MSIYNTARTGIKLLLLGAMSMSSVAMAQQWQGVSGAIPTPTTGVPPRGGEIRVCCPPIAQQSFNPYFAVHQLPGKNITQTYGLTFTPSAALDSQMLAYAPFAGLFAPAGWVANSVLLDAEMKELTTPNTSNPTIADFGPGTPVFQGKLRGYWTNSTIWNGTHGGHTWDQHFKDGYDVSPNHMQPNKWYMIKLTLKLGSGPINGIPIGHRV
jgi:hypothetical protein